MSSNHHLSFESHDCEINPCTALRLASPCFFGLRNGFGADLSSQELSDFLSPTLLSLGRKVVVVRCEGINISGNFYRNKCELGLVWWSSGGMFALILDK